MPIRNGHLRRCISKIVLSRHFPRLYYQFAVDDWRALVMLRSMDFDVRAYALKVLGFAKANLASEGYVLPTAFIVVANEVEIVPVSFTTRAEAQLAYEQVIQRARDLHALAIVTLNAAHYGDSVAGECLEPDHPGGAAEAGSAPDCIWITVSGPAIPTWELLQPYVRTAQGILYGELRECHGVEMSLLDAWASASESMKPS